MSAALQLYLDQINAAFAAGEKPPFPEVIDSTMVSVSRACQGKTFMSFFQHWKPKGESVHLHAGAAYARGLETARRAFWVDNKDANESVELGILALMEAYGDYEAPAEGSGSNKSLDRMLGGFEYYYSECPLDRDENNPRRDGTPLLLEGGGRAIEFSFVEPIDLLHPVTGMPLLYSGRADMIANWADGNYIWDDKTASQLGASWAQQWELRSQFSAYTWAARRAGYKVNGVITNGTAILKTKYHHDRAITGRAPWEVDRWYKQMLWEVQGLIDAWQRYEPGMNLWDAFKFNLDESCSSYGGCVFRQICKIEKPENWLPMYFERKLWDPLTRTETLLEGPTVETLDPGFMEVEDAIGT
jgi:hypothetical protein